MGGCHVGGQAGVGEFIAEAANPQAGGHNCRCSRREKRYAARHNTTNQLPRAACVIGWSAGNSFDSFGSSTTPPVPSSPAAEPWPVHSPGPCASTPVHAAFSKWGPAQEP